MHGPSDKSQRARWRGALAVAYLAASSLLATGCELALKFDRDMIRDGGIRPDGEVVGETGD